MGLDRRRERRRIRCLNGPGPCVLDVKHGRTVTQKWFIPREWNLLSAQIRKQPTNDGGAEDDVADDEDDDNDPLVESFISNRGQCLRLGWASCVQLML